jgi:Uma2 family endonuclease
MPVIEADKSLITAEAFAGMSFDVPTELVRGEILELPMPDQIHGAVCGNVYLLIAIWARAAQAGIATTNDSQFVTERGPDSVRGPDVCYFTRDRLPGGRLPHGVCEAVPNLCVEVLSPSDRWRDVHNKINEYLSRGVDEVWVINPRRRTLEVFRQDESPRTYAESDELKSAVLEPGFSCRVSELFRDV